MRKIVVPPPVAITNWVTDEQLVDEKGAPRVVSFREFLMAVPMADPMWLKDIEAVEAGVKIAKLARLCTTGTMSIEDSDFEKLLKALKTPTNGQLSGFPPQIMGQLVTHFSAITSAEKCEEAKPSKK